MVYLINDRLTTAYIGYIKQTVKERYFLLLNVSQVIYLVNTKLLH
ncbi:hypothetical protein K44PH129C1_LOCUS13 [Klebsiella phage vB_Kpl_K44PH129C1]|uniref:Uncharacterized protein n=1 Tax=Klebsiella phage vB_Kpl_K44PH129C1 TaxID=3071657 RepID=A0AAV1MEN4_9CAUD|nr:hypothetical protein K44PH129C1_LOCUS13 [Klebsiella phage vB_Kpl_K44PH129C1]